MSRNFAAMSEPISTSAGGWAIMKAVPILGPVLATIIVMCLATPKSRKEWVAALTATVAMSLFGGSMVVEYFNLNFGPMATTGVSFICGLPAWLFVRALFAWMDKQRDKDLAEIVKTVRDEMKNDKN